MKVEKEDEEILWENQEVVDNIVKEEYSIEENHENVNSTNQFVEAYPEDESSEDEILTAVRAAVLKQQAAGKRKVAIKCHICGEKFYGASTLRAHLFKHKTTQIDNSRRKKKPNKISCKFCPGTLFNSGELNMHMQINHQCLLCGQEVLNEQMREAHLREFHAEHDPHFAEEEKEKFNCSSCNESFSQQHDLDAHTEEQHDATSFFCLLCNEKFQTKAILLNHMKSHQSPKANKMTKGVKEETPKGFPCDECNEVFHSIEDYVNHKRIHVRNRLPGIHQRIQCDFCSETFADTTEFNKHLHMHVSGKNAEVQQRRASFVCDYCNADFFSEKAYISHIRDHKTSLECPYCLKSFEQRLDKEFHMRWNHPGLPMNSPVLPTRCSICKLILSTSDDVKNHSTQHVMNSMEPLPEPKLSVQNIKPKVVPKANKTKSVRGKYKKRRPQSQIQHEKEMKQQKMEEKQQKMLSKKQMEAKKKLKEKQEKEAQKKLNKGKKKKTGEYFSCGMCDDYFDNIDIFINHFKKHKKSEIKKNKKNAKKVKEVKEVEQPQSILIEDSDSESTVAAPSEAQLSPIEIEDQSSGEQDQEIQQQPTTFHQFNPVKIFIRPKSENLPSSDVVKWAMGRSKNILSAPKNQPFLPSTAHGASSRLRDQIDSLPITQTIEIEDDDVEPSNSNSLPSSTTQEDQFPVESSPQEEPPPAKKQAVEKPVQPASVEPPALKPTEQISALQKGNFGNTFKISTIDSFVGSFESFVNNYGTELDIPKKPPKFQKKR